LQASDVGPGENFLIYLKRIGGKAKLIDQLKSDHSPAFQRALYPFSTLWAVYPVLLFAAQNTFFSRK